MSKQSDSLPELAVPSALQRVASGTRVRVSNRPAPAEAVGQSEALVETCVVASAGTGRRLRSDVTSVVAASTPAQPAPEGPLSYLGALIIAAPLALLTMLALCFCRADD